MAADITAHVALAALPADAETESTTECFTAISRAPIPAWISAIPERDGMSKTAKEARKVDPFDWSSVIDLYVHPLKVAIIEALIRIGEPLSATDLRKSFAGEVLATTISQHLLKLAKAGILEEVSQRRVRGATEKFYFFSEASASPSRELAPTSVELASTDDPPGTVTLGRNVAVRTTVAPPGRS